MCCRPKPSKKQTAHATTQTHCTHARTQHTLPLLPLTAVGGCSPETPKLAPEELPALLALVPAWRLAEDGGSISRRFTAKNFVAAVDFLSRIVPVAEAEAHHP